MVNDQDNVYKKHQNCNCQLLWWSPHNTYRLKCLTHNKWLHTLTMEEADHLILGLPEVLQRTDCNIRIEE
jgi:hypothetical protein